MKTKKFKVILEIDLQEEHQNAADLLVSLRNIFEDVGDNHMVIKDVTLSSIERVKDETKTNS